jgi:hypothetical protein
MNALRRNYKIYRGSTFRDIIRLESSNKVVKPISEIIKGGVTSIISISHGLTPGWRFKVSGVVGMKEINTNNFVFSGNVTDDTIQIPDLDSSNYGNYISGGFLKYNLPEDLSGATARMQLRATKTSDIILAELTTENNLIKLDMASGVIALELPSSITQDFLFKKAVYSLEVLIEGIVTTVLIGSFRVEPEITR